MIKLSLEVAKRKQPEIIFYSNNVYNSKIHNSSHVIDKSGIHAQAPKEHRMHLGVKSKGPLTPDRRRLSNSRVQKQID